MTGQQIPLAFEGAPKPRRKLPRNPGRAARRKGHDFERDLVHLLRSIFGDGVHRGVQGFDVRRHEPDIAGCGPLFFEAKRGQRTNPRGALRQAEADMAQLLDPGPYRWPVAVCRDDGEPAFVVMRLADFLGLVAEWWGRKGAI